MNDRARYHTSTHTELFYDFILRLLLNRNSCHKEIHTEKFWNHWRNEFHMKWREAAWEVVPQVPYLASNPLRHMFRDATYDMR